MSRTLRYYQDWINPKDGYHYRLIITPWDRDTLTFTGAPSFGGGSTGVYYQIPPGTFPIGQMKPGAKFDNLPVGMPDSPTMQITVDYRPLEGDSDLEDLWSYLQDPEFIPTNPNPVAPGYTGPDPTIEVATLINIRCATRNYFELLSDCGNSSLSFSSFTMVWAGCQYATDEPEERYNPLTGSNIITIELVHILRVALESIPVPWIAYQMKVTYSPTVVRTLYDVIYEDGGVVYMRTLLDTDTVTYREFSMYRLEDLSVTVSDLLTKVVALIMRTTSGGVVFESPLGPLCMYDWLDLRQQDYTAAGTASATPVTEPWFVGTVAFHDAPTVEVDGWLTSFNGGKDTLYSYKNAYELLKEMVEGCGAASTIGNVTRAAHECGFVGILYDTAGALDIAPADFKGDDYVMKRAKRLNRTACQVRGSVSGDVGKIEYIITPLANDSPRTIPSVFTNLPQVGERSDANYPPSDISIPFVAGSVNGYAVSSAPRAWNRLYYFDSPSFVGESIAIRVHHYVGIADSAPIVLGSPVPNYVYESIDGVTLPTPGTGASTTDDFWYPLRIALLAIQQSGGLPYAASAFIAKKFSHTGQVEYPTVVAIEKALPRDLGRRTDPSFADGSDLTGQARHALYIGQPVLVSTDLDIAGGESTVTLLGVG